MVGVEKMKKYQGCCWLCCYWAAFCNYSTFQSGTLHTEAGWLQPPIVGSTHNGWMIRNFFWRISDNHIWGLLVHYVCLSLFQFNPTSRLWCLFFCKHYKDLLMFCSLDIGGPPESKKIHLVKIWLKKSQTCAISKDWERVVRNELREERETAWRMVRPCTISPIHSQLPFLKIYFWIYF